MLALLAMQDCERDFTAAHDCARSIGCSPTRSAIAATGRKKVKGVEPSGWAFERANLHYPDIDDTAVALIVLSRLPRHLIDEPRIRATIDRALAWTLAMQSSNGGWAAFDKDNDRLIITKIPFCDFGEALDPPSADVTAHVLEALGLLGFDRHHPAVARGYRFLRSEQETDGSWFGRWGVNHIYGTAAVLPALAAIGEDMTQPYVRAAADWLVAHQNADGGWGETCASYMDDSLRGRGPSTASQTGWALVALRCDEQSRLRAQHPPRNRLSHRHAARRRHLERAVLHRHGVPRLRLRRAHRLSRSEDARAHRARHGAAARLHDQLQPLPALLPADGARPRAQIPRRVGGFEQRLSAGRSSRTPSAALARHRRASRRRARCRRRNARYRP